VISPDITGVKTHGCEIKVKKQQLNMVHSIIFNLLFTTNNPLIENSSIIGITITTISNFSGVLKVLNHLPQIMAY
jgi:hypothetical protein